MGEKWSVPTGAEISVAEAQPSQPCPLSEPQPITKAGIGRRREPPAASACHVSRVMSAHDANPWSEVFLPPSLLAALFHNPSHEQYARTEGSQGGPANIPVCETYSQIILAIPLGRLDRRASLPSCRDPCPSYTSSPFTLARALTGADCWAREA